MKVKIFRKVNNICKLSVQHFVKPKSNDISYGLLSWRLLGCLGIGLIISWALLSILSGSIFPKITDNSPLQVCVIIIGGIPTIYLWVINQRKKEK